MRVRVQLFATLSTFLPPGAAGGVGRVDIPERGTVDDLVRVLGIPPEMSCIVLVNGQEVDPRRALDPEDEVTMFPPLAGG